MEKELRILILEDDDNDAELIRRELEKGQIAYASKCVASQHDFLAALAEFRPDLVLSDHNLPGFTGMSALALARNEFPELPFILVTGALGEELAVQTIKDGATDYVRKDRLFQLVPAILRAVREAEQGNQRRQAERVLRESEARFRQLTDAIREVFWMTDSGKNQMIYVSPGYEEIWGRTCESLYASPQNWVEAIHPDDRQGVLQAALSKQVTGQYDEQYRILRPDGSIRWIQDRAFPIRDGSGKVYRVAGIAEDITERKQAEAQLATLAHAVESTTELISITDLQDRFTFVNRAFQQAYGYTQEEILGKTPEVIVSPKNPPSLLKEILRATRSGGWRGEVLDRRKDGTEFPISLTASQVTDRSGRVIGLIGIAQDITERKEGEKRNAAFAALGHNLNAATTPYDAARIIMDIASELFRWDAGYVHLYSQTDDKILPVLTFDTGGGRRVEIPSASMTPDPSPLMRLVMKDGAQLTNRPGEGAVPVKLVPFGDTSRPSASMMYVPIHSGGVVQGLLSIQCYQSGAYSRHDLTLLQTLADHCGNALQRIKVAEALRESERNLRLIAENTTDVIFAFDLNRQPLYVNPAVETLTGYTFAEIQEKRFINWIHPHDQQRMLNHWDELFTGKGYSDVEFRLIKKMGQVVWCSSAWGPIFDESGRQIGVQGRERDITDRKQLEQEVLEISANERRRVGHELHDGLGQYLAGIAFKAKALEHVLASESVPHSAEAKELAGLISNAISQTRSLARGLDPIEVESIGLVAALQNLATETHKFFNVSCLLRCSEPVRPLDSPASLALYRIVQEAIHNAITHGEARQIEISLATDISYLNLRVRDDGAGFDPQARKPSGMGLRVMQYRARSIGASLNVDSRPGQGAEICCAVPRAIEPAQ